MHFSELTSEAQTAIVDAVMGNIPESLPDSVKAEIKVWAETDDFAERSALPNWPMYQCKKCGVQTNIPGHCGFSI